MNIIALAEQVVEMADTMRAAEEQRRAPAAPGTLLPMSSIQFLDRVQERIELRDFLLKQPPAVIYTLITIMYAGRDDNPGLLDFRFLERYEEMSNQFESPAWAVSQILGKKPLAAYLRRGLDMIEEAGILLDMYFS